MRSLKARIRSEIERAVEKVLDRHVQGAAGAQSREYIARVRTSAWTLKHEASDITELTNQEVAWRTSPVRRLRG
jgi:hypothetical protein